MRLLESITKFFSGGVNATHVHNTSSPSVETKVAPPFEIHSNNLTKVWVENQGVISGFKFSATMQLRTPLRVLLRHGEIHSDINTERPKIAHEFWEGSWVPKTRTYRELGLDIDELSESTMASPIGQIKASDYLPFLISVREIVEANESIDSRINMIRSKPMTGSWKAYVNRHGGIDKIINQFFPLFIDTIPKLSAATIDELCKLGIDTANKLVETNDEALLDINGIGKAKLKAIRDYCAGITKNRDETRLDRVSR